jgi:hypothetical protein
VSGYKLSPSAHARPARPRPWRNDTNMLLAKGICVPSFFCASSDTLLFMYRHTLQLARRSTMASSYDARMVWSRLRQAKNSLKQEVRQLINGSLLSQLPCGYEFQERGSFWSYLIPDVTDIDLMFVRTSTSPGSISDADVEMLHRAAGSVLQSIMKYRVVFANNRSPSSRIAMEYYDWATCRRKMKVRLTLNSCFKSFNMGSLR